MSMHLLRGGIAAWVPETFVPVGFAGGWTARTFPVRPLLQPCRRLRARVTRDVIRVNSAAVGAPVGVPRDSGGGGQADTGNTDRGRGSRRVQTGDPLAKRHRVARVPTELFAGTVLRILRVAHFGRAKAI